MKCQYFCNYIKEELICPDSWSYTRISWILLNNRGITFFLFLRKKTIRKWIVQNIVWCAVVVFFLGILLYMVGFNWEGTEKNPVALFLRSVTASMEMFVSGSELIEVDKGIKENPYYMMLFSIIHFLAVFISAVFIIHIMDIRLKSYLCMRLVIKNKKDVFVFFDLSQESINLAKDIYKARNENCKIVFVRTPIEGSNPERFSFSHILNFSDNKNEAIEELIGINAFLIYSRKSVTMSMDEREWNDSAGLSNLSNYLKKSTGRKYFFCLSANEDNNINAAVALGKRYIDVERYNIYCRANKNSITESLYNLNLKFIDVFS